MTDTETKEPFLGWTNDKDILNQQREYWGAMNGINELREENNRLRSYIQELEDTLGLCNKDEYIKNQEEAAKNFGGL